MTKWECTCSLGGVAGGSEEKLDGRQFADRNAIVAVRRHG